MCVSPFLGGEYPGGGYMALELNFVSARTNKRHHHQEVTIPTVFRKFVGCAIHWIPQVHVCVSLSRKVGM